MASTVFFTGISFVAAGSSWVYRGAIKEATTMVLDNTGPIGRWVRDNYNDYKSFKEFLREDYSNTVTLHYAIIKMVSIAKYRSAKKAALTAHDHMKNTRSTAIPIVTETIDQNTNNKPVETHMVEYYYNNHVYAVKINTPMTYEQVIAVTDETGTNVLKTVQKYMGPAHDFHGGVYTVKELGYEKLEFSNGLDSLTFSGDEPIVLNFPSW